MLDMSGVAAGATKVTVDNAQGFATDDFIQIGKEVLKITGIQWKRFFCN